MQLGRSIWKQLTHIILLDEQMRVTDQIYQGILNRLREGKIFLLIVALSCIAKRNENISNFALAQFENPMETYVFRILPLNNS